jgi:hypothetical protein
MSIVSALRILPAVLLPAGRAGVMGASMRWVHRQYLAFHARALIAH